jgi:outer membrane protein OmpA-like peptidoglycan-associated protein
MKNIQFKFLKISSAVALLGLVACAHDSNVQVKKLDSSLPLAIAAPTLNPVNLPLATGEVAAAVFDSASATWTPLTGSMVNTHVSTTAATDPKVETWKSLNVPVAINAATNISTEKSATQIAEIQIPKFQLKMDGRLDSLKYAVYFDYASANLNPTGKAAIEALQQDASQADSITIIGYADPSGNAKKNVTLANSRANTVRVEFAKYGIITKKVVTKSAVALSKPEDRLAFKQNVPAEISAASRRADVDIAVKPNATATATSVDKRFVTVSG